MKKKTLIILGIAIILLLAAGLFTSYADQARVRNSVEPVHTIKIVTQDGTKVTYWGLGYKVIRYPSVSPDEPYENCRGVKYGSWFMQYEPTDENNVFNRVWHSDFEGVYVQVTDISNDPEKTTVSVSWNNKTDFVVTYGEEFRIERLEKGEWADCSLKERVFNEIGYLLDANKSIEKEYSITDIYDLSKPGTYRFHTTCSVEPEGEYPITCDLWTEFIVE